MAIGSSDEEEEEEQEEEQEQEEEEEGEEEEEEEEEEDLDKDDSEDSDVLVVPNNGRRTNPRKVAKRTIPVLEDDDEDEDDDSVVVSTPIRSSETTNRQKKRKLHRVLNESDSEVDEDDDWNLDEGQKESDEYQAINEDTALEFFNTCDVNDFPAVTACTIEQAEIIAKLRPFSNPEDLRNKLRKKKGISSNILGQYQEIMKGYMEVDRVLTRCEKHGDELSKIMTVWAGKDSASTNDEEESEGAIDLTDSSRTFSKNLQHPAFKSYIFQQPPSTPEGIQLKPYQMIGVNWLNLLYSKNLSCILADEMGLGKTAQVICFLSHLKHTHFSKSSNPPQHLIIVPASTLDNWIREFQNFSSNLSVRAYYGNQVERAELRYELKSIEELDVVITTYGVATGSIEDRKFLEKMRFDSCVYDEGHQLKNSESKRYKDLMRMKVAWRLLLTGTPLQNNLQELVSLLSFILPKIFQNAKEDLRTIFKVKADSQANMLAQSRVTRAKKMMTPFVLRRKKAQVLKDLPKKIEKIVHCEMEDEQGKIYKEILRKSKKYIMAMEEGRIDLTMDDDDDEVSEKPNGLLGPLKDQQNHPSNKVSMTTNNVVMDLRKAANHPMLFRKLYDDRLIGKMSKDCLKELEFYDRDAGLILEDMDVMTDFELHVFASRYKHLQQYALKDQEWMKAGKIKLLKEILKDCESKGSRVLIFSQFTQMLSILEVVMKTLGYDYLILTGSTSVDERQPLVDRFTKDESISVFLLSTRAGGLGLNLMAADTVIIFDQDFNPHNDRQAEDRAYRLGQKRDVKVIKFITKDTIEEDILQLASHKITLDDTVSSESKNNNNNQINGTERAIKNTLMANLRKRMFEED
ncbi:SNF2 family N-terminal domain-domain-containing protein [Phakopsora pachyrhizi]|uniref:DNA helicase n=1 Tax=Phakopsora pachyrhizi TaxID=170000 RepID=A0AAV0AHE8_PHAPC|nr:SNF2 family N-terminal domain-domain-containing protein [Phakopsora pachyrhizi]